MIVIRRRLNRYLLCAAHSPIGYLAKPVSQSNSRRESQITDYVQGDSAILWIGGTIKSEIATHKESAKRTAIAMREALTKGVLPGGGISLLACCPTLRQAQENSTDTKQHAAYHILSTR